MLLALIAAAAADPRAVLAPSGLRLRDAPDREAGVLAKLPYGSAVALDGPAEGEWVAVTWGEQRGYLAGRWLSRYPPPPEGCEGLADWADRALGPPTRIALRLEPEPGVEAAAALTRRDYGDIELRQLEDSRGLTESITLPGLSPAEGWLIGTSCLRRDGAPVLDGAPPRGGDTTERAAGCALRLHQGPRGLELELLRGPS